MAMSLRVNASKDTVAEFCQRRRIRRLAFFGSPHGLERCNEF